MYQELDGEHDLGDFDLVRAARPFVHNTEELLIEKFQRSNMTTNITNGTLKIKVLSTVLLIESKMTANAQRLCPVKERQRERELSVPRTCNVFIYRSFNRSSQDRDEKNVRR